MEIEKDDSLPLLTEDVGCKSITQYELEPGGRWSLDLILICLLLVNISYAFCCIQATDRLDEPPSPNGEENLLYSV